MRSTPTSGAYTLLTHLLPRRRPFQAVWTPGPFSAKVSDHPDQFWAYYTLL